MTFEQATETLAAKLPVDVDFSLRRETGRTCGGLRTHPFGHFELTLERYPDLVPARTFDVKAPGGSLEAAVGAAIDWARNADAKRTADAEADEANRAARERLRADCPYCENTGHVNGGALCPVCDRGIPF